jgi:hypothetical protein
MPFDRTRVKADDLIFQRDFMRHLLRHWQKHLSASEFICVLFIYDRTIGWGKFAETIMLRHFIDGIVSRDLRVHHHGTSLSRTTVIGSLERLEAGGLIESFRSSANSAKMYLLKIEASEDDLKQFSTMKEIAKPKRLKSQGSKFEPQGSEFEPQGSEFEPHKKKRNTREVKLKKRELVAADASKTLADVEVEIEDKRTARADARKKIVEFAQSLKKKELARFWLDTVSSHHDDMRSLALTIAQQSSLFSKQKTFLETTRHALSFPAFVDWSIQNWHSIMSNVFGWMTNAPSNVDAWFFLKHFDKFFNTFEARDRLVEKWETARRQTTSKDEEESSSLRRERDKLNRERSLLEIERSKGRRLANVSKKNDLRDALNDGEFKLKEHDE